MRVSFCVRHFLLYLLPLILQMRRSQWPRGLRRRSTVARLLRSWVRIPPGAWMFVCCEYCVLSRRGLCDELITRPEESYRLWCVVVCDLETSWMRRRPKPTRAIYSIFSIYSKCYCEYWQIRIQMEMPDASSHRHLLHSRCLLAKRNTLAITSAYIQRVHKVHEV